jgi:tetratricopeptide (TPR) repeat protein
MIFHAIARALPRHAMPAALLAAWCLAAVPAAAQEVAQAREQGRACMTQRKYACAEAAFSRMIRLRPADPAGYAMRGIAYTRMERYREAIADLERAMDMGEGTWDIVANYAEALRHTGRTAEAIDWSYRTLTIVSTLVDVRGDLATMLVGQGRHHEALSLLGAFDAAAERKGQRAYFGAQRLVIEQALLRRGASSAAPRPALRLPKLEGFFHAPVSLAEGRFMPFVVDTGASTTVMPRAMLAESRAAHSITRSGAHSRLADGRTVEGQLVSLARLAVGPHELKDVPAFVCDSCAALLGQEALKHFDLQSSRQAGVEFMTMTPRAAPGR